MGELPLEGSPIFLFYCRVNTRTMSFKYELQSAHTQSQRLKEEREKAKQLRKSDWWRQKINQGICEYCQNSFPSDQLTMDHIVPLARGGRSTKNNLVAACKECNSKKKLDTPVDQIFKMLEDEKKNTF